MLDVCVFGNDPIRWMCDAFVLLLEKSGSEHNLLVEKEGVPSHSKKVPWQWVWYPPKNKLETSKKNWSFEILFFLSSKGDVQVSVVCFWKFRVDYS